MAFSEVKTGTWVETYTFFAQSVNHFASSLVDGNVDVVYQPLSGDSPGMGKGDIPFWFKNMLISCLWVMKFRYF